jgi:predicted kinase
MGGFTMFFLQMSGFPGSGKSTLARLIAQKTGAIVIDHDIVKTALLESMEAEMDAKAVGKISYHIEWSLIDFHLSQGFDVILDSPCLYTEMLEKGTYLSKKYSAKYKYVECYLDDIKEINARLKNRQRMISQIQQAPPEEAFKRIIDNSKRPSDFRYLVVDSSQPLDSYINEVLDYIRMK